jgi:uncharacterized Zn finger protein
MARKGKGHPATAKKRKRRIRTRVIPEPEANTRSVLIYEGEGTVVMKGPGNVIMECGNCGVPLVEGVAVNQLQNLVFRCPNCGEYNETLA